MAKVIWVLYIITNGNGWSVTTNNFVSEQECMQHRAEYIAHRVQIRGDYINVLKWEEEGVWCSPKTEVK